MKFIHLTDSHVIGGGRLLYGTDPARRLRLAVDSINAEHPDAAFVVHTGDITEWGNPDDFEAFAAEIRRLEVPIHLVLGNHDDAEAFAAEFPTVSCNEDGFVQSAFDTDVGRFILLDSTRPGSDAGAFCEDRCAWLRSELESTQGPVLLFMHHPPFKVGIHAMDNIMLQDAEAFYAVIKPHKSRIRHLFFGHLHRAVFGNWRGISYSCMRGLNHQVALDLTGRSEWVQGSLEGPAYGVVLLDEDSVTVHMHEFADSSPRFALDVPDPAENTRYKLSLRHEAYRDL